MRKLQASALKTILLRNMSKFLSNLLPQLLLTKKLLNKLLLTKKFLNKIR